MQEKVSELEVHLECGSAIGLCGGGKVVTQKPLGQIRRAMGGSQDACGIDQHCILCAIGIDAGLQRCNCFIKLAVFCIELAEINIGLGGFTRCDRCFVLRLCSSDVLLL